MKKYHRYSSYQESGVKTLGNIPSHWTRKRLKQMARIKNGQDYKHVETTSAEEGYPVIGSGGRFTYASEFMFEGESVLLGRKGTIDKPLYINAAFWSVDTMFYTQMLKGTCAKYLYYCSITIAFNYYSTNTALPSMTQEDLGGNYFAVPEYDEQYHIVNFLDHETDKIDTLIDKQQQLIKLLKEKRQAVISHAVTKGLNPDAPMKDSGVEWLGEVPEHWVVAKLRYLVDESAAGPYGASLTKTMYTTSGYRVYGQQQVIAGSFKLGDYYISKEKYAEMKRYTVYPDDVLISVMGTVGKVAVVPANVEPGIINPRLVRYVFNKKLLPEFVKIQISSSFHQDYLLKAAQGSTMDGLNMGILGGMSLAFPKAQEQQRILGHVKKVSDTFSRLISFSEKSLELLQERRTALISAAVTGKIDVRNWQPAQADIPMEAGA